MVSPLCLDIVKGVEYVQEVTFGVGVRFGYM
jgi:hypothetical protein